MAFAIIVSMVVSFTLTPMLSARFLKPADAERDQQTKDRGFFHWIDLAYSRSLEWALAHPMTILGITVVVLALTIPLNNMVGRTFIPGEDMGEFTAHVDTPQGTSFEGHAGDRPAGGGTRSGGRKGSRGWLTWPAPSAATTFTSCSTCTRPTNGTSRRM
jgi:hypothetical protein